MAEVCALIKGAQSQDLVTLDQMVICLTDDGPVKEDTTVHTDETITDTQTTTTALIGHHGRRSLLATLQTTTGTVMDTLTHPTANGNPLDGLIMIVEDTTARDPQALMTTDTIVADHTTTMECTSVARIVSHLSQGKNRM